MSSVIMPLGQVPLGEWQPSLGQVPDRVGSIALLFPAPSSISSQVPWMQEGLLADPHGWLFSVYMYVYMHPAENVYI